MKQSQKFHAIFNIVTAIARELHTSNCIIELTANGCPLFEINVVDPPVFEPVTIAECSAEEEEEWRRIEGREGRRSLLRVSSALNFCIHNPCSQINVYTTSVHRSHHKPCSQIICKH